MSYRGSFAVMLLAMVVAMAGCISLRQDPFAVRQVPETWCAIGTSITWYDAHPNRFEKGYQTRVREVINFSGYFNAGNNGGCIAGHIGWNIPKADIYSIEHGINDWGHCTPVGTIDDYRAPGDSKSFFASYRRVIDHIRSINPNAKIVLCTPRKAWGFGTYLPARCDEPKGGIYLREYAEAVRTIAKEEGFEVADFYATCGEQDELPALSIDKALHPNDAGFALMAAELIPPLTRALGH